jgi:hypothetical protein
MVRGDAVYNKHFRYMVRDGLACGLDHPIEWLVSYSRCIAIPYDEYAEVTEFCDIVAYELFELMNMKYAKDYNEVQAWIDRHYAVVTK